MTKKLGFGLMRLPLLDERDEASIDIETCKQMVDLFMSRGFTYFDTAIMYCGAASQRAAKTILVDRYPRDSFTLATKLHSNFVHAPEDPERIFREQLEQTGAGYFDYYLLHGIKANSYPIYEQYDCFNWLLDKQRQGLVRHVGFSFHDTPELLDRILREHPEMEFVQMQLNYLDWESEWIQSRAVYETAVRHGKPVVVMEPVKGGTLAKLPAEAETLLKTAEPDLSIPSWGIRFAASQEHVFMVLSGMSTPEQVLDNTGYMQDFRPLSPEEIALTRRAAEIINRQVAVACTGCSYCTDGCPMQLAIPKYFSLYNEDMREDLAQKGWTANYANYAKLTADHGRAGDCIGCGQCEGVCPQHLPIISLMRQVSAHYDG